MFLVEIYNLLQKRSGILAIEQKPDSDDMHVVLFDDEEQMSAWPGPFSRYRNLGKITGDQTIKRIFEQGSKGNNSGRVTIPVDFRSTCPEGIGIIPLICRDFVSYKKGSDSFRISIPAPMGVIG